jgi:hypothetical protein
MFRVAAQGRNALADALSDGRFPVENFLLHEDLGPSVKNQYQWVLDYLLGPDLTRRDRGKRLNTVVDWALTKNNVPSRRDLRLYQINRNAATLLASPWRKLWEAMSRARLREHDDYPFRLLLTFIDGPLARDAMFAGHFQCVFETFIRCSRDWITDEELDRILRFAIANINIQAYNQLICHMGVDLRDAFAGDARYIVFVQRILYNAAVQEFTAKSAGAPGASFGKSMRNQVANIQPAKELKPLLNADRKPLARPRWLLKEDHPLHMRTDEPYLERLRERQQYVGFTGGWVSSDPHECFHAQQRAFWLLKSVSLITLEDPTVCLLLNKDTKCSSLAYLLICGIYSDPTSMVSKVAF